MQRNLVWSVKKPCLKRNRKLFDKPKSVIWPKQAYYKRICLSFLPFSAFVSSSWRRPHFAITRYGFNTNVAIRSKPRRSRQEIQWPIWDKKLFFKKIHHSTFLQCISDTTYCKTAIYKECRWDVDLSLSTFSACRFGFNPNRSLDRNRRVIREFVFLFHSSPSLFRHLAAVRVSP